MRFAWILPIVILGCQSGTKESTQSPEAAKTPAKAEVVGALAKERGIDLQASAAYSDSINDLPLLEAVGEPHAVNPDQKLRHLANHRGWPVHEFRHRRVALLVGVPSALAGAILFGAGVATFWTGYNMALMVGVIQIATRPVQKRQSCRFRASFPVELSDSVGREAMVGVTADISDHGCTLYWRATP